MGDTTKPHHRSEAAEFGRVRSEQDLEDSEKDGANADARADERKVLGSSPDASGYFERQASHLGGALNLEQDFDPTRGRDLRDHAKGVNAADIDGYERAYNMYSIPYGMTMKALGRTKDLSTAGAPLTASEFKKKQPKLAARFAGLTNGREPGSGKTSFDTWSQAQMQLSTNVDVTDAAQVKLKGAILGFQGAQAMIHQRQLAARKAADTAELNEINETAETLARIVDVSVAAVATAAEIETAMSEGAAFDENAEGVGDLTKEGVPQSNHTDWVNGTGDDPTGAQLSVGKSGAQRLGGAAGDAKDVAAKAKSIGKNVGKAIKEGGGGKLQLTLKDMFIVADGDAAKYDQLTKDIQRIDKQSAKWADVQFTTAINKARMDLDGAVMEVHARQMGNKHDVVAARRFASDFASAIGGGADGELAMYSAEAYQELAAHGSNAADIRSRIVDGPWKQVFHWMNNYPAAIKETLAGRDAKTLATNLQEVREEREFLDGSLPEWKQRADEWSHFFSRPLV